MSFSDRSPLNKEKDGESSKAASTAPTLTIEEQKAILARFGTFSFDSFEKIQNFLGSVAKIGSETKADNPRNKALKKLEELNNNFTAAIDDLLPQQSTEGADHTENLAIELSQNDKDEHVKDAMRELLQFVIKNEALLEKYPRFVAFKNALIQVASAILGTTVGFFIGAPAANPLVHAGTATAGAIAGWEAGKSLSRMSFLASNVQKLRANLEQLDQAINPPLPTTAPKMGSGSTGK